MVTVIILPSPGFRMKSIPTPISLIGLFPALWRTKMLDENKMVQIMALGVVTVGLIFGIVLIMALDGVN
jgi:hypothetical protein